VAQGATIAGTIGGASSAMAGVVVGVAGTSLSSTSDGAGNFTIVNVPPADVTLTFSGPGVNATAPVGSVAANDSLHVDVTVSGSVATVEAQQKTAPDSSVTADGTIADLDAGSRQFRLGSTAVSVPASAAITRGGAAVSFGDLMNGDRAYVRGMKDGSVIRASQVDAQPGTSSHSPSEPPASPVTLTGTVSNMAGTCPSVSFTVQGTAVKASSATTFDGTKGCSVMANGDAVAVGGTRQSDGSVLASKVNNATAPPATEDTYANGPIAGLTGACPAVSFTLSGTPVKTSSATTFNGRACAELKNGDVIYAAGPKQADGTINATRTYYTPPTVTLTGTVTNMAGTCPSVSFTVQGTAVKASSATTFDGTKGCSLMANADSVTVVGTTQSDGSVLASKVTNATAPPATEDTYANGPIAGLTGACPAVSFTLSGTPVKTSSATTFNGRACAELKNGDVIYAAGPKQADGTINATRTYYTPPTVTLTGTVSNMAGTCPSVSFTVQGTAVKASSATTFDGTKGCSLMANADSVTVVGTTQSDGSVLASKVTNATAPPAADTYVNGPITGLAGVCPALSFSLSGTPVKTSSATTFNSRTCAELKNGDIIYAAGPKQADGTINATRTYYTPPSVTLTGTVSNFGGTWPTLTFTVQGTAVKTSSSTTCDGTKGCSLMANGDSVTVAGTTQSDGSVLASKITNATAPPAPVTLTGTVSGLGGTCPAVTLTVQSTTVKGTSATTFDGTKGCSSLANGDSVTVVGTKQSDGSVVASKLTNATDPPIYGTIANLAGTCPAVTMSLSGTVVKTTSATTFTNGACADLKNGGGLYAVGTKQSDGSVLASQIYFPKG
jgi:hypothetical protein